MRLLSSLPAIIFLLLSFGSNSQTKSLLLKMELPSGSKIENNPAVIKAKTAVLDEYIISKDYTLTKTNAEVVVTNLDNLKNKLQEEKWSIRLDGTANVYRFQKDNSNVLATVESSPGGDIVAMKLASMPSASSSFIQTNKIVASDRKNNMEYGRAVAITNNYAVVGVKLEDRDNEGKNPKQGAGAAYIYERGADNKWTQVQKIVASDRSAGANFGWSVALSGNTIVVGATYERFDATGRNEASNEGAAYVFERGSDGVWKQTQKLLSSTREGYDYFGTSVGIDGNIIVVGAPGHSKDSTERQEGYVGDAGAVFVFEKKGNNWRRTYKLIAYDRGPGGDNTGNSVAISGNYVIAGSWGNDFDVNGGNRMEGPGAAYIWERLEDGKWTKAQKLVASDRSPYDEFGFSVAIDGDNAVVGARGVGLDPKDENFNGYTGEAYIFSRNENGDWKEVKAIRPEDRKSGDYYGSSVGVSGNYAFVGAWRGDTKKADIGVIYIYWKDAQGRWTLSQKIAAADEGIYSDFSTGAAIHHGFIISGSPMETRDVAGKNEFSGAGAAYIFIRTEKATMNLATKQTSKTAH